MTIAARWLFGHFCKGADLFDSPGSEDGDMLSKMTGIGGAVGHEDAGHFFFIQNRSNLFSEFRGGDDVKIAVGFVEEDEFRFCC